MTTATAEVAAHAPAKCKECGTELPFLGYGSKIGRDGREAKWPVYAKCQNPTCRAGRKNMGLVELAPKVEPLPIPDSRVGKPFTLRQLTNRLNPPLVFDDLFEAQMAKPAGRIVMHMEDVNLICAAVDNAKNPQVTSEYDGELDRVVLTRGKQQVSIYRADQGWRVTKSMGYYTVEDK